MRRLAAGYMDELPAAVIFDMDGLLFDSEALYQDAIIEAAQELGHNFTVEDFLKLVGRPWEVNRIALQDHIGSEKDVEAFRSAWLQRYHMMRGSLVLKSGAAELLDHLSSNSLIVTHLVLPFAVEFDDRVLDGELEVFDGWEGAVGEEVALEITPGPLDVVELGRVFR